MLYVLFSNGSPVAAVSESPYTGTPRLKKFDGIKYDKANGPWDWQTFAEVKAAVAKLNLLAGCDKYLATDSGPNVAPRFGLMEMPKVGDPVSYGFNGDYYPDGYIEKITKTMQIKTTTGSTYRRRKESGSWLKSGGTWGLVKGHRDERNPHF